MRYRSAGDVIAPKLIVIYTRFSDDDRRPTSSADQSRKAAEALERVGFDPARALVFDDQAMRGDRQDRPAYQRLLAMIGRGEVAVLAVDQQSRFGRGHNIKALVQDLVYHDGRFIAAGDGIDTARHGWEDLVGFKEMTNSSELRTTSWRVRRGMEGRVLDGNGSAGDYPMGYRSEWADPAAAAAYTGTGRRPTRVVVVDEAAAKVVVQIFELFAGGLSTNAAVRHLKANGITKYTRARKGRKAAWSPAYVRQVLSNPKYVGDWSYGLHTTVKNSAGKKKFVPVTKDHDITVVRVHRPDLRIVSQDLWDRVQTRLARLKEVWGKKPGDRRGQRLGRCARLYPKSLLANLVRCGACGAVLHVYPSDEARRFRCPNHYVGACTVRTGGPVDRAEAAVGEVLRDLLAADPEWMPAVLAEMRQEVQRLSRDVPERLGRDRARLKELDEELENVARFIAKGTKVTKLEEMLDRLTAEQAELLARVAEAESAEATVVAFPDEAWVGRQLRDLPALAGGKDEAAPAGPEDRRAEGGRAGGRGSRLPSNSG
jgi:DNA invertase Pin-like site-specific DNA recombinase